MQGQPGGEGTALLRGGQDRSVLFEILPTWAKVLVPLLLVVSLALNITVLMPGVPFLTLDVDAPLDQFLQPGTYGVFNTLDLLADNNLYLLYVIIFIFSICWPPVKILATAVMLVRPMTRDSRGCWLAWMGHLGRWSLVDVYFALLLMMIAWQQGVAVSLGPLTVLDAEISTLPEYGMYVFHFAILCSMAAVTICQELSAQRPKLDAPPGPPPPRSRLILSSGALGGVALVLAFTTLVLQLCVVILPAFTIVGIQDERLPAPFPLRPYEHAVGSSIYETVPLFALDMTLWLLIVPNLTMVFCICALLVPITPGRWAWISVRYLSEWSMLDVYLVALIVYLTQESDLITLQLGAGTYVGFCYIPVMSVAVYVNELALKGAVERETKLHKRAHGPKEERREPIAVINV